MMRIIVVISLLCFTLGCARKEAGKGSLKLSGRNATSSQEKSTPGPQAFLDSTFYVGYVDYFPETKEFYTALFYKEGYEYPDEDLLESKLDSVIIFDDDWGRERLPMEEAKEMLVLSGLDTIYIYNRRHEFIARAYLSRVEYLWNGLESYFIGVFGSDVILLEQTEELYGISLNYVGYNESSFTCQEFEDVRLNKTLMGKLNIDPEIHCDMRHFKTKPHETTYSIISWYAMESHEGQSYITALENNEVAILNQQSNDFHYLNILPLPLEMNHKPLFLITAGYPFSDILWDYLAAFDGTTYEAIEYNRVHPEKVYFPF